MKRVRFAAMGIVGALLLLYGGGSPALAADTVHIGFVGPLTGGAAFLGVDALKGVKLAVDEINEAGGITVGGKKYTLSVEQYDDEATPAKAVAGLRKLKDRFDIPVVIADVSGSSMALTEINERLGILWCGFARHPMITQRGNKLALRYEGTVKTDTDLAAMGAVELLKAKTYAILCDTGDWGRGLQENFAKAMEERGVKLLGTEWFDMRKDSDFRVQITKIKALNPDTVKIVAYDEASGQIVKQCREMGITVPLVMTTGFQTRGVEIAGAENIEGCINIIGPANFSPLPEAITNYRSNFEKKYNQKSASYGENNYELVYAIARGMEKSGSVSDAHKIKEGMMAAVPVEKEHRTAWLQKWTENGDGVLWRDVGFYKNGELVDRSGNLPSPPE